MNNAFIQSVSRMLLPPAFVVAVAVWLKGYAEAGDSFGAGVLAALAILLQYVASGRDAARQLPGVRYAPQVAGVGLLLLLGVTFVPLVFGHAPLSHVPGPGEKVLHLGVVEVYTAVLFDVGISLVVMGFVVTAIDGLLSQRSKTAPPGGGMASPGKER
ncbi:MnhB domain-containing protein [Archangium primigenium]|uniref:MnhB domain-containing protein n=1 Tax=[Archangium] primigenium TaxID=2792470 RepID=UPI00195BC0E1|nr:MnhB domain-containing protein [Archangium primigenium]MBM7112578.1 MnhB domain-containing protein [Archangium primigenium]